MRGNKWILYIALFTPLVTFSQVKISGHIEANDGPLSYANIVLKNIDGSIITGVMSDDNGNFNIHAPIGEYYLNISFIGYKEWLRRISVQENKEFPLIILQPEENSLGEVVINSSKRIIDREFDKLIFNVDVSPLRSGYNGLQVIERSPGLRVNSDGQIISRNDQMLVLINGRKPSFSNDELINYIKSLNSEDIKKIEIQNMGGAETDASNNGGVINIILKKLPKGFRSRLRMNYAFLNENYSNYDGNLSTQFGSKKWNIYNKTSYSDDQNLSKFNSEFNFYEFDGSNVNNGETDYQNKNLNTTTGVVYYPNDKNEFACEFYFSESTKDRDRIEELNVYNPDLSAISKNISDYEYRNNLWNIITNYTFVLDTLGSRLKFIGDLGSNTLDNTNIVETTYLLGNLNDNINRYFTDATSNFYNVQIDWTQNLNDLVFTIGGKLSNVTRDNQLLISILDNNQNWNEVDGGNEKFNNDEYILANYFTLAKTWNDKHSFKLGLRTEYTDLEGIDYINNTNVDVNYFDWFPSLYYGYDISKDKSISISYSRRIRRPSFTDLNPFIIKQNDFLFQTGNPNLRPQYTNKFDLSYRIKKHNLSGYFNVTDNLIAGIYNVENNVSYYYPENFGKSNQIGLEYSYSNNITDWLYTNISSGVWNYTFKNQNRKHEKFTFYGILNSQVSFLDSDNLFIDISTGYISDNQYQVVQLAHQFWFDLAVQKKILKEAGTLRLAAEDIFNTQRSKNASFYENFNFNFYQKRITRTFSLTFIYNLTNNIKVKSKNTENANDNLNRL